MMSTKELDLGELGSLPVILVGDNWDTVDPESLRIYLVRDPSPKEMLQQFLPPGKAKKLGEELKKGARNFASYLKTIDSEKLNLSRKDKRTFNSIRHKLLARLRPGIEMLNRLDRESQRLANIRKRK